DLKRIGVLLDTRPQDPDRLVELHRLVSRLVGAAGVAEEDSGEARAVRTPATTEAETNEVLGHMAALAPGDGAAAQDAGPFAPLWTGARELLRTLSYYAMKKRAGVVGEQGLGPL